MNIFTIKGTVRSADVTLAELTENEDAITAWVNGGDVDQATSQGWVKYKGMAPPLFSGLRYRVHQPREPMIGEVWGKSGEVYLYALCLEGDPSFVAIDGRATTRYHRDMEFMHNTVEEYFNN